MLLKVVSVFMLVLSVSSYRILVVFPAASRSHAILGNGYVKHLLDAGHEVTYLTTEPIKTPHPKLSQIDVGSSFDFIPKDMIDIKNIMKKTEVLSVVSLLMFTYTMAKKTILHENAQALLHDTTQNFDVVIAEWMFNDLNVGFSGVFNCPYIISGSLDPHWTIMRLVDEATNPAYTADMVSNSIPPFDFGQRVFELWHQIKVRFSTLMLAPFENSVYNEAFGPAAAKRGHTLPPLGDARYNASMILGNSMKPLSPAIRLPANYKEVGGYHIDSHNAPLPDNIKIAMDEAKHGVIYFSMGSNAKSKDMPDEMKSSLLKNFGELKQVVLWKFEEELEGLPKNVHILKWAPQTSILGHPSCILFISHGGLLSITETIHFGVPIIGVPAFADQFMNIDKAVVKGFALKVDLAVDMAEPLKRAIHKITSDKKYQEKVKELSTIYHDRLVSPGAELVHWVEHVVRTKGAPHLRSPALMVPWYQKMYLDLILILVGLCVAVVKSVKLLWPKKKAVGKVKKNK